MHRFRRTHEFRLLVVTVGLVVLLSVATPRFLTVQNGLDLLTGNSFIGMTAAGLLVVLVSGGIDISFTAIASVAQYVALEAAMRFGGGWATLFVVALGVGTLLGVVNAVLISTLRISSIIVSIAMLNVYFGLLMFLTHGNQLFNLPDWFIDAFSWVVWTDKDGNPYVLNAQMIGLVVCFALSWVLLNRTSTGRQIYALGGNAEAAARMGFDALRLNLVAYGYLGFVSGLASLAQAQLAQSVAPNVLVGRELSVLAAVVLGGASLTGGQGTVFGMMLGVAVLAIMENGLILLGVSSYWTQFFVGGVIVAAVTTIALERRRQRAATRRVMEGAAA
jgi:simple sugar transport system permease protein